MSDVTIRIGGRNYTVACGPGEEARIAALGDMVDGKLTQIPNLSAQSEARMLLYATLLLADELQEAGSASASTSAPTSGAAPAPTPSPDPALGETLENLAEKLESLASRLEDGAAAS